MCSEPPISPPRPSVLQAAARVVLTNYKRQTEAKRNTPFPTRWASLSEVDVLRPRQQPCQALSQRGPGLV